MEIENYEFKMPLKSTDPQKEPPLARGFKKAHSPLRLRYQAEVNLIRKDLGNLEEIRGKMGLSRRKMCQLLLVDPSAWTRWTRDESKVPPHIFKTLACHLELQGKYSAYRPFNGDLKSPQIQGVWNGALWKALSGVNFFLLLWLLLKIS